MARRKAAPVPETVGEVAELSDEEAIAAAKAAEDMALLEALQERDGNNPTPAPPRMLTLGENYLNVVALVSKTARDYRVPIAHATKLWELNMLWAINNRGTVQPSVFPEDDLIGPSEGESGEEGEPPIHETITADEDQSDDA